MLVHFSVGFLVVIVLGGLAMLSDLLPKLLKLLQGKPPEQTAELRPDWQRERPGQREYRP